MTDILQTFIHDWLVLFAMVNAVGNLPIFADYTEGMSLQEQHRTFRIATAVAASIVLFFAVLGHIMLYYVFEVSVDSFKIAGGILVFAVAARGILFEPRPRNTPLDSGSGTCAVFPLGFPFLAGPGTIVTTILLMQIHGPILTVAVALSVYLAVLPLLQLSHYINKVAGKVGVMVVTRILYIFIAAKAVAFVIDGLTASFNLSN